MLDCTFHEMPPHASLIFAPPDTGRDPFDDPPSLHTCVLIYYPGSTQAYVARRERDDIWAVRMNQGTWWPFPRPEGSRWLPIATAADFPSWRVNIPPAGQPATDRV